MPVKCFEVNEVLTFCRLVRDVEYGGNSRCPTGTVRVVRRCWPKIKEHGTRFQHESALRREAVVSQFRFLTTGNSLRLVGYSPHGEAST